MTDNEIIDEYDCNLATYLSLPEYFHDAGESLRENYYFNLKLIKILENTPNVKNRLIKHIKLVLDRMDDYGIYVKELLIIYIYTLFDTQAVIDLILSSVPFKTAIMKKLTDITNFQEYRNTNPQLLEYLTNNFIVNKGFLSIKKNSDYRKRMLRIYMKIMVIYLKLYDNILEKRYAPDGIGAIESKNHFNDLLKIHLIL